MDNPSYKKTRARLAPSPTGQLHLGNAWSFLIAWLACRLDGGEIFLRMEDIDPQRSKKEFAKGIIEDLTWLGIDWDLYVDSVGESHEIVWQSERYGLYEKNVEILSPYVYKCYCTRKELREMASAPQKTCHTNFQKNVHTPMPDIGAPYSGKCRFMTEEQRAEKEKTVKNYCLRLACPSQNDGGEFFGGDNISAVFICNDSQARKQLKPPQTPRYSGFDFFGGDNLPQTPISAFFCKHSLQKNAKLGFPKGIIPFGGEFERQSLSNWNDAKHDENYTSRDIKGVYAFEDYVLGKQEFSLTECGGDFALKRSDGVWAYQLAVVSDDVDMGINQIVRGCDILMSTPRQLYIYDLLNAPMPFYAHIPLLLDENGERLAKRHKSLSLASLREKYQSPQKVVTYLASLMGIFGKFPHASALLEHIQSHSVAEKQVGFPWALLAKNQENQNAIITQAFL